MKIFGLSFISINMCVDVENMPKALLERAKQDQVIKQVQSEIPYKAFQSAYSNAQFYIITQQQPELAQAAYWDFNLKNFSGKNHNAKNIRSENAFRISDVKSQMIEQRCLIMIPSFYKYHHLGKNTIKFRIEPTDESYFLSAGVYQIQETDSGQRLGFTMFTTKPNEFIEFIQNEPKNKKQDPRQPVLIRHQDAVNYLNDVDATVAKDKFKDLFEPFSIEEMKAHTINLKARSSADPNDVRPYYFPELQISWMGQINYKEDGYITL